MSDPRRDVLQIASLMEVGRFEEARRRASVALAESPDDSRLLAQLARACLALDDYDASTEAAARSVAADPTDEWGHRLLAQSLSALGEHDRAEESATEAVRLAPQEWQTHATLAQVAMRAKGRLVLAREAAYRAATLAPHESSALAVLGSVAHAQFDYEYAEACYRRALAIDPEDELALNNLAVLKSGALDVRGPARSYASILRLNPSAGYARSNIDMVLSSFVGHLAWIAVGGLVLGLLVAQGTHGSLEESEPHAASVVTLVLVLLVLGGYTAWVARGVPEGARAYARAAWRRVDVVLHLLCVLGALAGLAAMASLDGGGEVALSIFRWVGIGAVVGIAVMAARHCTD